MSAPAIAELMQAARAHTKRCPRPGLEFWRELLRAFANPAQRINLDALTEVEMRAIVVQIAIGQYASDETREAARARWAEILGVEPAPQVSRFGDVDPADLAAGGL